MKKIFFTLTIFVSSCQSSTTEYIENKQKAISSTKNGPLLSLIQLTNTVAIDSSANQLNKIKNVKNSKTNSSSISLIGEAIGDNNWNGKPVTMKIVLSQKNLKEKPDTLYKVAMSSYKNYESIFPRAIADNIQNGTSKEIISYPQRLSFSFELYEKEYSKTPFSIKKITIKRGDNGELTSE